MNGIFDLFAAGNAIYKMCLRMTMLYWRKDAMNFCMKQLKVCVASEEFCPKYFLHAVRMRGNEFSSRSARSIPFKKARLEIFVLKREVRDAGADSGAVQFGQNH